MEWGTIAGMITAGATMITAVGGIYLGHRVQTVHKIVNQQRWGNSYRPPRRCSTGG